MEIPPASFSEYDLEQFFQQLNRMELSESIEGKIFILRRMLNSSLAELSERWLLWTFHSSFRLPCDFLDIQQFEVRPAEGVGLVMSWRVLARIMDDLRVGRLDDERIEKSLIRLLENVPQRVMNWFVRLLQHRLTDGIDKQKVKRIAPGLL